MDQSRLRPPLRPDRVTMPAGIGSVAELNQRSREVFREIVEAYVETSGGAVGSRTLSRRLRDTLSPATIRNVMSDLEEVGLLRAPHTSAGRLPTDLGLRLFVSGLLEVGGLAPDERVRLEALAAGRGRGLGEVLEQTSSLLSGLSGCAGLVLAPKTESPLVHIEFVALGPGRALVVMVTETGAVENRVIDLPPGLPPSALTQATNYLSSRLVGRTLDEAKRAILDERDRQRAELDELTGKVVDAGLAVWGGEDDKSGALIIRGQANLLDDITAIEDLERIRGLFAALETKDLMVRLLDRANRADGVEIFIGAENGLFGLSGCSLIVAPIGKASGNVVGAIGIIGPTYLNYARIIPMVDYTAKLVDRILR